ncbi:MAG: AAA family ATPase [Candidatus Bathyarchaeia archaeon]
MTKENLSQSGEGESGKEESYLRLRGLERQTERIEGGKIVKEISELRKRSVQTTKLLIEKVRGKQEEPGEDKTASERSIATLKKEIEELVEAIGGEAEVSQLRSKAWKRLINYMRLRREIEKEMSGLQEELKKYDPREIELTPAKQDIIAINDELREMANLLEIELPQQSPEAFLAHWLLKLREYKKSYQATGIIETPGVQEMTEAIREKVKAALQISGKIGVAVLLGETGSGKTAVAREVAEQLSPDGEYEFVQAHFRMMPEDLIARLGIKVTEIKAEEIPDLIEQAKNKYKEQHPQLGEEDLKTAYKWIEEVIKGQAMQRQMETQIVLEAVAKAAREGRIVVIDEFNYLPPETLAALNTFLDVRPGSSGAFSLDSEKKTFVKEGFGVIFTGNIGERYAREKFDPAFINRIGPGIIEYNYPPQAFDGVLTQNIITRKEVAQGRKPLPRDLFIIGTTLLVDAKGNLIAPPDALQKLWDLCRGFSIIQQLTLGKDFRDLGFGDIAHQHITGFKFDYYILSFRQLISIVERWKTDGFQYSLDWYIYDNIIKPAFLIEPREAAQIFYILKNREGFLQDEKLASVRVNPNPWNITNLPDLKKEDFRIKAENKYYLPQEIAEAVAGIEMPSYEEVEEAEKLKKRAESERLSREKEKDLLDFKRKFSDLEKTIEILCSDISPEQ